MPAGTDGCTLCIASDGITAECENTFHLFLRLQDESGHAQITVTVDQNVCPLYKILIYITHPSVGRRAEQYFDGHHT